MPRLTPNAAAERSGQSRATITRAIAAGELEATKHRNRWSIDLDDLDRWTAQRPLSAGRGVDGRFQRGEVPEPSPMPLTASQSAAEGPQGSEVTHTRLEALEALCGALRAEIEDLREQVQEMAGSRTVSSPAPVPEAKRRLWPFSAKS